jgi:peptidyl-dipeptidase A
MSLMQCVVTPPLLVLVAVVAGPAVAAEADGKGEAMARRFVEYYETTVRPLEIDAAKAFWTANVTGKEEDFAKKQETEEKFELCLADPQRFAELKAIQQAGVADRLLARQVDVLYLEYLAKQVPPELLKKMLAKSNAIERAFNVFRPTVGGKTMTDNDLRTILRESRDHALRRAAWEAGKKVGPVVVRDLLELVNLRNEAARRLGFKNYHVLQLYCTEQNQEQVLKLFDELDALTREPFRKAKAEMDRSLAKDYGVTVAELKPWHYHDPFFQEAPTTSSDLPESVYKPLDPAKVCRAFYDGIGLSADDILARSSLYEKPGKNPHAFSIDMDRAGDVRILENIVQNREWLATTLHELGHAVYSKYVPGSLPYVLRTDAHPLCTEGVAMMFERFAMNVDFLRAFGAEIHDPEQFRAAAAKLRRNRLLVFARYCQVMFRFEAALYDNPRQDLNRLWWDTVERYQEIKQPEGRDQPDFASKYHLIGAPAYYHNYMMGEMFASQVHHALVREVLPGKNPDGAIYVGDKAAGRFMKQRVFERGLTLNWNELTRYATGKPLSPKAFAEDLETVK